MPTDAPLEQPGLQGKSSGLISSDWYRWLFALAARSQSAASVLGTPTKLTTKAASISATPLTVPALNGGLYRVSWYARITQAATVSSSLTVTIGFTESGLALTEPGAAITGNTTTTVQSGSVFIRTDAAAPITYATTYASSGATPMQYRLDVVCEQVA